MIWKESKKKQSNILKKNISDIINFRKTADRPLVLDGAVGSLLQQKGESNKTLWSSIANLTSPEKVRNIHKAYINAGADIITTNTFRTNPIAFSKSGLKINYKTFIAKSVEPAYNANAEKNIFIAASNSPAEDCYQIQRKINNIELTTNHQKHISALWETDKINFILNETFGHFDEIKIVSEFCYKENIPYVLSLFTLNGKTILSGEKTSDLIKYLQDKNSLAVSFNCIFPEIFSKINLSYFDNIIERCY